MGNLFNQTTLYRQDRELLRTLMVQQTVDPQLDKLDLVLECWQTYPVAKIWLTYEGEVPKEEATLIELAVQCAPAQFWMAKIIPGLRKDGKPYAVSTGSGDLCKYWPMFRAIAENCLVVKEL